MIEDPLLYDLVFITRFCPCLPVFPARYAFSHGRSFRINDTQFSPDMQSDPVITQIIIQHEQKKGDGVEGIPGKYSTYINLIAHHACERPPGPAFVRTARTEAAAQPLTAGFSF